MHMPYYTFIGQNNPRGKIVYIQEQRTNTIKDQVVLNVPKLLGPLDSRRMRRYSSDIEGR